MENEVFFMKNLVPGGKGGWTVHRFAKDSAEGAKTLRDALLAVADWGDATRAEWDDFQAAASAVGEIAGNIAEWSRIESLSEASKGAIRVAVQEGKEVTLAE